MKTCTKCHKPKPEELFPEAVKTYTTVKGEIKVYVFRRGKCKQCVSEAMRKYSWGSYCMV